MGRVLIHHSTCLWDDRPRRFPTPRAGGAFQTLDPPWGWAGKGAAVPIQFGFDSRRVPLLETRTVKKDEPDLFDVLDTAPRLGDLLPIAEVPDFSGPVYDPGFDHDRLAGQILRIYELMQDGRWRTLAEIAEVTGDPPASVSAQLRHLRKPRFGAHNIAKRPRGERSRGLWEYAMEKAQQDAS